MATITKHFKVTKAKPRSITSSIAKSSAVSSATTDLSIPDEDSDEDLVELPNTAEGIIELSTKLSEKKSRNANEKSQASRSDQQRPGNKSTTRNATSPSPVPIFFGTRDYKVTPLIHQLNNAVSIPITNFNPFWTVDLSTNNNIENRTSSIILAEREDADDQLKRVRHTSLRPLQSMPFLQTPTTSKRAALPGILRTLKSIFFLHLDLDAHQILHSVLDDHAYLPSNVQYAHRLVQRRTPMQQKLLQFVAASLQKAVELYPALLSSTSIPPDHLTAFSLAAFDMDPHYTATRFLSPLADAIDITGIYARAAEGLPWRRWIRVLFCHTCEVVWRFRFDAKRTTSPDATDDEEMYQMWRLVDGVVAARDGLEHGLVPVLPLKIERGGGSAGKRKRRSEGEGEARLEAVGLSKKRA